MNPSKGIVAKSLVYTFPGSAVVWEVRNRPGDIKSSSFAGAFPLLSDATYEITVELRHHTKDVDIEIRVDGKPVKEKQRFSSAESPNDANATTTTWIKYDIEQQNVRGIVVLSVFATMGGVLPGTKLLISKMTAW